MPWNILCFEFSYTGLLTSPRTLFWGVFWCLSWNEFLQRPLPTPGPSEINSPLRFFGDHMRSVNGTAKIYTSHIYGISVPSRKIETDSSLAFSSENQASFLTRSEALGFRVYSRVLCYILHLGWAWDSVSSLLCPRETSTLQSPGSAGFHQHSGLNLAMLFPCIKDHLFPVIWGNVVSTNSLIKD